MKFPVKMLLALFAVLFCAGIFLAVRVYAQAETQEMAAVAGNLDGLRLPLAYHDNGKLKTQLKAETAMVPEKGPIQAKNITCEFFTVEGVLDTRMIADECVYDREAKKASSDSKVRVERKDVVLTGNGYEWDSNEQNVTIMSNVKVIIDRPMIRGKGISILKGKK